MLFVSNFYPPHHLGGYEMLCHEVATHMIARGHQVNVLTSTYGLNDHQQDEPRIYRRLKLESDIHFYRPYHALMYWKNRRINMSAVEDVMTAVSPEVVVVWGMWNLSNLVAEQIEALAGARAIYYISDRWPAIPNAHRAYWDREETSVPARFFKILSRPPVRLLMRGAWEPTDLRLENVLICSEAMRDQLLDDGIPLHHAKVLYHGIDPHPYREARERHRTDPASDRLRLVFVGTLAPHKGPHTIIEALMLLRKAEPDFPVSLTILGKGHPPYEERLRRLVEQGQLENHIMFHEPIPRSELPDFLAQFDALVQPSIYAEPQARISQEAMAAGLVLIATPTGGTREILDHDKNGLAFEPENAEELAAQIKRLEEDSELSQRLTHAGWQTVVDRFTIFRMIDEFEAYVQNVAAKESGRSK
jgi:glycosyltransferase involved in cell wall biosynthesis